ncbi:hypothetical protein AO263_00365 [Pseudomonas sp. NZIPFR-PS5]|nr:hypothetical protein AO263_00365 [Pseudomonas sp. NZIPFR-PS5]
MGNYLAAGALNESAHSTAMLLQEASRIYIGGWAALSFMTVDSTFPEAESVLDASATIFK